MPLKPRPWPTTSRPSWRKRLENEKRSRSCAGFKEPYPNCGIEDELLKLTQAMDALRVDLPKQAIEEYKKLSGFEMGLARMGWVSLEYGYQLALARLRTRHPSVEIDEDPFTLLPEDADVPMAEEQPFDDSSSPADG
ncbi:hypothetical protein BHM03_00058695 [Ensete ventricosum]|nr:hypothetical protein BHM03_00058695 [Ensete ventricosum]